MRPGPGMLARRARGLHPRLVRRNLSSGVLERDVVIVGGGPVGLALAGALGAARATRDALSVTLVEAADLSKTAAWSPSAEYSNRVVTLTNTSRNFFENFGAWDFIRHDRVNVVDEIQAWDGISGSRIEFSGSRNDVAGITPMSRVVEVLNIQHALLRKLHEQNHVEILGNVKVESITRDTDDEDGWPLVRLSDGQVLRSRLLVGADGFNSPVRKFSGIDSYGWDYNRRGVVATLHHVDKSESFFSKANTTAYQRFLPTGPIAFLPLSSTASSLVWSLPPHIAEALQACEPQVVAHMVNAAFRLPEVSLRYLYQFLLDGCRGGASATGPAVFGELKWREEMHGIEEHSSLSATQNSENLVGIPPEDAHLVPPLVTSVQAGSVASFPLRFQHADAYIGTGQASRTCLVGDAAHTMNPLAGQGLNIGLSDAEALARIIEEAVQTGGDIGAFTTLLPYARERYAANHVMLSGVDKLHKLYSFTSAPVVAARSIGLEVTNELGFVKDLIMMSAGSKGVDEPSVSGWGAVASAVEAVSGVASISSGLARELGHRFQSALWRS